MKLKKCLYRFYEMVLWLVFLLVNIPYTIIMTIPYIITGKDYISDIAKLHDKLLFKKPKPLALRRTGSTTRMVDGFVQMFFDEGECTVYDHYSSRNASQRTFYLVLNRLKHEHGIKVSDLKIDKRRFTISKN